MSTSRSLSRIRSGRGSALLMVLWLSAALSAIAFSVALTVRNELSRADTNLDGLKAYYLACGAADRAVNHMVYGQAMRNPNGTPRFWEAGMPLLIFDFPSGQAVVEIRAESAKMNINTMGSDDLFKLLLALGLPPEQARPAAMAVMHWRGAEGGPFDQMYLARTPSFRAPHASFQQIEELMAVAGITPELFYGGYSRTPQGALLPRSGLRDCLSIFSPSTGFDINTVDPAVMLAVGVPPPAVEAVVAMRRRAPILRQQLGAVQAMLGPAAGRFRMGGEKIYTLRATGRLRRQDGTLSDLRRSVAMTVQIYSKNSPDNFRVLAWQDNAAGRQLFDVWPN
ncbi:general secretion pathway protein GspK [Paludibaculum fermentans]|uniref:general secretion pathway protein GspK n=1 Tax=Paludibaculum fermentans TaxID=1473598 RepID=UPI003EB90BE5